MEILQFILDVSLAFMLFTATMSTLRLLATIKKGRYGCGGLLALLIAGIVFTVFYRYRYPLAIGLISIAFVFRLFVHLRYLRPKNHILREVYEYYGQQLSAKLDNYQVIDLDLYGYEPYPKYKSVGQVYLIIERDTYFRYFDEETTITNLRWEFISLAGITEHPEWQQSYGWDQNYERFYRDQVFIVLILERDNAPSIAIPVFGGTQAFEGKHYDQSDVWLSGLSWLHTGAELSLYPLERRYFKFLCRLDDASNLFVRYVIDQPFLKLDVPPFTDVQLSYFWDAEAIETKRDAEPIRGTTFIVHEHQQMRHVIQRATT